MDDIVQRMTTSIREVQSTHTSHAGKLIARHVRIEALYGLFGSIGDEIERSAGWGAELYGSSADEYAES